MTRERKIKIINEHMAHGRAIVEANKRSSLHDLPWACALVQQESEGRNIFGCDYGPQGGSPPFCGDAVTHKRIQQLLNQSKNNGVGLTQLTDRGLVLDAERKGGAHLPLNQCLVGFRYLKRIIDDFGIGGIWHFNGSPAYQSQIEAKHRVWVQRFTS
jgi:hypothetical protein